MFIYLDHNATTPVDSTVVDAVAQALKESWANPSSVHQLAQKARESLEASRQKIASYLKLPKAAEVVWTSGGTEANMTVLYGTFRHARAIAGCGSHKIKNKLIISAGEHACILKAARVMQEEFGIELVEIPLTGAGTPDLARLRSELTDNVFLVSMMLANNETGVIYPVEEIGRLCRERGVLFHTDSVNALGKMELHCDQWPVDFYSFAAHKVNGPKGIGALIIRTPQKMLPLFYGGGQERNRRAGTENVAGAVGFAAAITAFERQSSEALTRMRHLRDQFEARVKEGCSHARIVAEKSQRMANTSCICFESVSAQQLLISLDLDGVCVSSGSACASGSLEPSHVLMSMGFTPEEARSTIRMSLGRSTTEEEMMRAAELVVRHANRLRETKPLVMRELP